jgi:threonine synthase
LRAVVFCPHDTPLPKMAQAVFFGAHLIRVRGHYSEINAMYRQLIGAGQVKWYDCGTDNPFRYEGKKTYAYEIAQALAWRAPDRIVQPAAGGMSLAKTWKGFNELRRLGWCEGLPKMTVAQSAACGPIARAFERRETTIAPVQRGATIASAVAAADPGLLGQRALDAVRASGGAAAAVSDDEVRQAMRDLASEGLFVEPSGSVGLAALRRLAASGVVGRDESVVCVLTGSGFKDFDRVLDMVSIPERVVAGFDEMVAAAMEAA